MNPIEPWLRGPLPDLDPLSAAVFRSFEQAREDLGHWTAPLSDAQIWNSSHGLAPVGFQLRHIAGSIDRLMTYLLGRQLTDAQLADLRREMEPGASRAELLDAVMQAFARAEEAIRTIDPAAFSEPRYVGRKQLPTTVAGLLLHIAEHTQRHVGQAIVTAKLAAGR